TEDSIRLIDTCAVVRRDAVQVELHHPRRRQLAAQDRRLDILDRRFFDAEFCRLRRSERWREQDERCQSELTKHGMSSLSLHHHRDGAPPPSTICVRRKLLVQALAAAPLVGFPSGGCHRGAVLAFGRYTRSHVPSPRKSTLALLRQKAILGLRCACPPRLRGGQGGVLLRIAAA